MSEVPQRTWLDERGRPIATELGDGTLIGPAPTKVGQTVRTEEGEMEIIWDGAKVDSLGTRGGLLPEYETPWTIFDILKRNAGIA